MSKPVLSVVVPVYNEEEGIKEFYRRLSAVLSALAEPSEMVFVDDGSADSSAAILSEIQKNDGRLRLLRLKRNFGHQIALKAGIDHALGQAVVTMDADLQDAPEIIPDMLAEWRKGHDVVYAIRASREGETFFKLFTAAVFYRVLRLLSSVKLPLDAGDFRLMDRSVAEVIRNLDEKVPYIRGWVAWAAKRPQPIRIERKARFAGETKYSLSKMLGLAATGFAQFTLKRPKMPQPGRSHQPVYELL